MDVAPKTGRTRWRGWALGFLLDQRLLARRGETSARPSVSLKFGAISPQAAAG